MPETMESPAPSSTSRSPETMFDRGLLLGIGLLVALLVVNAALAYRNTRQLYEAADRVTHAHQVLGALNAVLSGAQDAETGQRGFVITGNPDYLQPYNDSVASIHEHVKDLTKLVEDNSEQQALLPKLKQRLTAKLEELERVISLHVKDEGFTVAQEAVLTHRE